MAFPTTLDSFPSAATLAAHTLATDPHSTLHGNLGLAVAALEAKVGIDSSAVATSHDFKLAALSAADAAFNTALALKAPLASPALTGTVVVRQTGGVAGTDELQLSHDGTNGTVRSMDGKLQLVASDGDNRCFVQNAELHSVKLAAEASGNITFQVAASGRVIAGSGTQYTFDSSTTVSGTQDAGLKRAAAGVIGVTDASTGGGILEFPQVASGGSPSTNSARIYAKDVAGTAEMFVKDEAGNESQISPHAMDAPASFYDVADEFPFVTKEVNYFTANVRYINHSRQARAQQALYNNTRTLAQIQALPATDRAVIIVETFAVHNARLGAGLVQLDWTTEQNKLQVAYDAARAVELAARDAWVTAGSIGTAPTVRPVADIRKPKPAWLAARGG